MRRSLLAALAVSAVVTASSTLALAAPAQAASDVAYIALGDSYSSGVGAGPYSSYEKPASCQRSTYAFSYLWYENHIPTTKWGKVPSYASVACSGATTTDVVNSQLSALSASTTLVSITAGGNDVGFASTMLTCVMSSAANCVSAVQNAEGITQSTLPALLDTLYDGIRSHAPNARVVVLDYPTFFQLGTSCSALPSSETARAKINEGIDQVDEIIHSAASRHGFIFADVRSAFVGHQLCSGNEWLHPVSSTNLDESYHPTADGQSSGYLPVFTSAAG
jgi:lysophospholipase L1-like esterase